MNDSFGNISQDFLPDGYGDSVDKVIQSAGVAAPEAPKHVQSSGPNLPPYTSSEAPGPSNTPMTSKSIGTYINPAQVDLERQAFWGCLAGLPGVARRNAADLGYRDITESNGYTYRQYKSGKVKILAGAKNVGTVYAADSKAARVIEAAYGKYSASTSSSSGSKQTSTNRDTAATVGTAAGAFASQLAAGLATSLSPQASVPLTTTDLAIPGDSTGTGTGEAAGMPWGLILGGVAAVVVVGGVVYFATRKPKDEE